MKIIAFLLFLCCIAVQGMSQTKLSRVKMGKNDTIKTYMTELDGELVPWIVGQDVNIVDVRIFASEDDRRAYNRLKYNVYKVIPYARIAGDKYRQLQRDLATTSDKGKQKEMVKNCEKQVKELFNREVKNLTISQGEILIKLIDRETGTTSYELAKQLKGGFHAFMFQSVARIFGHNLKETYDPEQERDIEAILRQAGYYANRY
ncbi:DUF4294 domain-containing protein [Mucilaginibacter sp. Bleaf8]|uniref:DUF4294 domain-containing protein n=1 Tax=Mucilaginibacter sp. Bleaf8 TaxID=2834430 RepID=UPI001BCAE835|nr:DUF4294 domain-containing protein [Mucilaginibacter sp. Bleaf8]MBS7564604.1 DUF4294 domain-containing protein [Mucilaginibacter sp. Bleaf8]